MATKKNLPEGTVSFLFSDIEGSTRLLKQLGRERYGEILRRHNDVLRRAFADHGGIEIDRQGDAFFFVFRSAGAAVAAAVAAQRAMADAEWPDDGRVRVRIGLHTGEASISGDSYVGFAVHQAARLGDLGHGGQILASRTTAALVEHELPPELRVRDLGETRMPGLDRPEAIFQIVADGLPDRFPPIGVRRPSAAPAPPEGPRLLEREAEVAALRAYVDSAASGAGSSRATNDLRHLGHRPHLEARKQRAALVLHVDRRFDALEPIELDQREHRQRCLEEVVLFQRGCETCFQRIARAPKVALLHQRVALHPLQQRAHFRDRVGFACAAEQFSHEGEPVVELVHRDLAFGDARIDGRHFLFRAHVQEIRLRLFEAGERFVEPAQA